MMRSFSVAVRPGPEAERFNDAFYRFLELHSHSLREFEERCGMLETVPLNACEIKIVRLWSETILDEFVLFLRDRDVRPAPLPAGAAAVAGWPEARSFGPDEPAEDRSEVVVAEIRPTPAQAPRLRLNRLSSAQAPPPAAAT